MREQLACAPQRATHTHTRATRSYAQNESPRRAPSRAPPSLCGLVGQAVQRQVEAREAKGPGVQVHECRLERGRGGELSNAWAFTPSARDPTNVSAVMRLLGLCWGSGRPRDPPQERESSGGDGSGAPAFFSVGEWRLFVRLVLLSWCLAHRSPRAGVRRHPSIGARDAAGETLVAEDTWVHPRPHIELRESLVAEGGLCPPFRAVLYVLWAA